MVVNQYFWFLAEFPVSIFLIRYWFSSNILRFTEIRSAITPINIKNTPVSNKIDVKIKLGSLILSVPMSR